MKFALQGKKLQILISLLKWVIIYGTIISQASYSGSLSFQFRGQNGFRRGLSSLICGFLPLAAWEYFKTSLLKIS